MLEIFIKHNWPLFCWPIFRAATISWAEFDERSEEDPVLFELHQKNGSIFNDATTTLFSTTWKWWEGRIWNETKILSQKVRFQLWCYHLKIVDYLGIIKTIGITLRNFLCKDAISSFGIWLVNNDDIDLHILLFKTIGIGQCLSCYLVFRTYWHSFKVNIPK